MTTAPPMEPEAPASPPPAATERRRLRLRFVVAGVILAGAFAFLLVKGLGTALDYYLTVDQAVHQRSSLGDRTFNLEGLVVPGSIQKTPLGVDFTLSAGGDALQVVNSGSPPQLFQNDIPVIAVGHFAGTTFASDQILVKHSASYIAANPGRVTAPNGTKR
ncbi:MAG: cytochrome c maturation protein CcmE [Acidimicrobiales bacterium]